MKKKRIADAYSLKTIAPKRTNTKMIPVNARWVKLFKLIFFD